jgi:hypothetical protein
MTMLDALSTDHDNGIGAITELIRVTDIEEVVQAHGLN